jgi:hypothetical protein
MSYFYHTDSRLPGRALRFLDFGDLLRNVIKNHPQNNTGIHYGNPQKEKVINEKVTILFQDITKK